MNYAEIVNGDYDLLDTIDGIEYVHSGDDSDWIIAVSPENKLAICTNFLEMDDFYPSTYDGVEYKSDYAFVVSEGKLMCYFESKEYES